MGAGPDAGVHECAHGSPLGHRLHLKGAAPREAGLVLQLWTHKEAKVSERSRGGRKGNGSTLGQKNHLHRGESFSKKSEFSDLTQDL